MGVAKQIFSRLGRRDADSVQEYEVAIGSLMRLKNLIDKTNIKDIFQSPVDGEVKIRNNIEAKAIDAGRINKPDSTSADLSSDESSIVVFYRDAFRETEQIVFSTLIELRAGITTIQDSVIVPNIDGLIARFDINIDKIFMKYKNDASESLRNLGIALRNLRHFRKINGVNREPIGISEAMSHIAVLSTYIAFEALVTTVIFSESDSNKLINTILISIILSSFNILGGFYIVGHIGLRYLNSNSVSIRAWSGMLLLVSALSIIFVAMAAAHLRDVVTASVIDNMDLTGLTIADKGAIALRMLFEHPINFNNFLSMVILFGTIFMTIFSARKGYYYNDPIPGYGDVWKKYESARSLWSGVEDRIVLEIHKEIDRIISDFDQIFERIRKFASMELSACELYEQIERTYPNYRNNVIEESMNAALKRYREANLSVRTQKAPSYFNQRVDISSRIEIEHIANLRELAQKRIRELGEIGGKQSEIRDRLKDISRVRFEELRASTQGILKDDIDEIGWSV